MIEITLTTSSRGTLKDIVILGPHKQFTDIPTQHLSQFHQYARTIKIKTYQHITLSDFDATEIQFDSGQLYEWNADYANIIDELCEIYDIDYYQAHIMLLCCGVLDHAGELEKSKISPDDYITEMSLAHSYYDAVSNRHKVLFVNFKSDTIEIQPLL